MQSMCYNYHMKKLILFLTLSFLAFSTFAETRTFYFTRHGQRGDLKYHFRLKNVAEDRLMPKGIKQAELLGQYMKQIGFEGQIYVSPYYRTLETATVACNQFTTQKLILEPRCQEVTGLKNATKKVYKLKTGITKKELAQLFPNVKVPKKVKFPWRLENEKQDQADQRIGQMIDDFLKNTEGDIFVVCHGGILSSVIREMQKRGSEFSRPRFNYNCCLYSFTFDTETNRVIDAQDLTPEFMPSNLYTDNLAYILIPPKSKVPDIIIEE